MADEQIEETDERSTQHEGSGEEHPRAERPEGEAADSAPDAPDAPDAPEGDASLEPAAILSFEALEGGEDQPILPVTPIDDDDDADDADDDSDDSEASDASEDAALTGAEGESETSESIAVAAAAGEEGATSDDDEADAPRKRRRRGGRSRRKETQQAPPDTAKRRQLMVVNDNPGEECRIAILEDGRLEQIFAERESTATNVGNIYKGKVVNVEAAIQAAFIDFGEGQNGFLHVSDLHPRYFPGQERTETVGRKIPRRERPPIQDALKRGQEVIVQVLKEGLGTKGPTLTSYISIPGRLLVMMPHMDRVGVSRKVEDEDQRREMRRILDSLELPEGCGFILRTAGFDRTKTELQRDALYLQRLWEAMERRMASTGAPCTLYTESDLLVRTIRDVVDDSVEGIVVDSESAFNRARTFIQVVAPLNAPRLYFYDRPAPIFYAFGVEQQVEQIHSHKVPLPSGGALVIDQTEAMVTIDVNSGKSRSARDSETNAYNTNKEAVDEIARQLRLRDLGGIIVNDLIDMRSSRHRREIEERLEGALRHDRAKTTTLDISDFGIIEMTRQRMRPGLHKALFMDCPHCHGSGEVRVPDAVAADCLRKAALLFCYDRVHRVEIVCSVRVASVLLSARRSSLYELEERTGKRVDIRISETFGIDRVDIYAYDDRGADVEAERLPRAPTPRLTELPLEVPVSEDDDGDDDESSESGGRRRRRRRRKPAPADATAMALAGSFDDLPTPTAGEPSVSELIRRADAERQARRAADLAARAKEAAERAASGEAPEEGEGAAAEGAEGTDRERSGDEDEGRGRRRGRGGRGRGGRGRRDRGAPRAEGAASSDGAPAEGGASVDGVASDGVAAEGTESGEGSGEGGGEGAGDGTGRRRRRRRRGGRGRNRDRQGGEQSGSSEGSASGDSEHASREGDGTAGEGGGGGSAGGGGGEGGDGQRGGRRRRRRGGRGRNRDRSGSGEGGGGGGGSNGGGSNGGGNAGGGSAPLSPAPSAAPAASDAPRESAAKKTIRSVTGWMRRLKTPSAASRDDR